MPTLRRCCAGAATRRPSRPLRARRSKPRSKQGRDLHGTRAGFAGSKAMDGCAGSFRRPPSRGTRMLELMLRIRRFEEALIETFSEGFVPGFIHTYIGEEAVAAGVCVNLRDIDYIAGTHRGHGHCIAKGVQPDRMMAELMGKKTGTNKGKGGSMHSVDFSRGILGSNGIVASGLPIITGAALSIKMRQTDQVAVAFFGDGASNRGAFHEAVNLAAVWRLPAIFVCEDNGWAISVSKGQSTRAGNLADRAIGYGIPGVNVDGGDVLAVSEAFCQAAERARAGEGPTLIVCDTPRMRGHEEGDPQEYRPKENIELAKSRDPIKKFSEYLISEGLMSEAEIKALDDAIVKEMEAAVAYGKASPWPEPEESLEDLYAEV